MRIILTSLVLFLSACSTSPWASDEVGHEAKIYSPNPTKAKLYIYRDQALYVLNAYSVFIDGTFLTQLPVRSYYVSEVDPGKHTVGVNKDRIDDVELTTEAGKIYFLQQSAEIGLIRGKPKISLRDSENGKAGVSACKLMSTKALHE